MSITTESCKPTSRIGRACPGPEPAWSSQRLEYCLRNAAPAAQQTPPEIHGRRGPSMTVARRLKAPLKRAFALLGYQVLRLEPEPAEPPPSPEPPPDEPSFGAQLPLW